MCKLGDPEPTALRYNTTHQMWRAPSSEAFHAFAFACSLGLGQEMRLVEVWHEGEWSFYKEHPVRK